MCDKMKEIVDEEVKEAIKKLEEDNNKKAKEVIKNLIKATDWDDKKIAEVSETTEELVAEVRKGMCIS